jgi:spermidine synthase
LNEQQLFLERGPGARLALFINGDLQFDSTDERRYHEYLALPPLAVARGDRLRVLILGGGDGLALREVLRDRRVAAVDLVDIDPNVLALARTELRDLNEAAFEDPRVQAHAADAREFVASTVARGDHYEVILCDFTVPDDVAGCGLFAVEWFGALRQLLAAGGALATNAVSPVTNTQAFWGIHNALRAAGWDARPYHFTLPSFSEHGYGEWGFVLALGEPCDLAALTLPAAVELTPEGFREALRFSAASTALQPYSWPSTTTAPHLLGYLLDPDLDRPIAVADPEAVHDFATANSLPFVAFDAAEGAAGDPLLAALYDCLPVDDDEPLDVNRLIAHLPVQHSYHTREMVETILDDWTAYLRGLDLARLLDTVLARAKELPARLRAELVTLRARLHEALDDPARLATWGGRVLGVLLVVIMLANTIAPDSVFAKNAGGHVSTARPAHTVTSEPASTRAPLAGQGFSRSTYGRNQIVDVQGYAYPSRRFVYYPRRYGYYRSYYGTSRPRTGPAPAASPTVDTNQLPVAAPVQPPVSEDGLYYVTEDALLLQNSDMVVTLDTDHYLLLDDDAYVLLGADSPEPVYGLYRDPALTQSLITEMTNQRAVIAANIADLDDGITRQRWIGTVLPAQRHRSDELVNLRDTDRQLAAAIARLQAGVPGTPPPAGAKQIFVGVYALPSGVVALHNPDDTYSFLKGTKLYTDQAAAEAGGANGAAASPALVKVVRAMLDQALQTDTAELSSFDADIADADADLTSLQSDLQTYTNIQRVSGNNEQVDYGTSEIAVIDAIAATQRDIDTTNKLKADLVSRRQLIVDEQGPYQAAKAALQ